MRLAQLPEVESGSKQRPVYPRGELLHARIEIQSPGSPGRRLDDTGIRMRFHHLNQARETGPAHHAVGVQHQHVTVERAPATTEVIEIAALALHPALTTTVEHLAEGIEIAAKRQPGVGFLDGDVRIEGIAQDEDIEMATVAALAQGLDRRADAGENPRDVLVADRHQQRRARVVRDRLVADLGIDGVAIPASQQLEEAHQGGPETGGDPCKQQHEQRQNGNLQPLLALIGQYRSHLVGGYDALAENQHQQYPAARASDPLPARDRLGLALSAPIATICPVLQTLAKPHEGIGRPRLRCQRRPPHGRRCLQAGDPMLVGTQDFGRRQRRLGIGQSQATPYRCGGRVVAIDFSPAQRRMQRCYIVSVQIAGEQLAPLVTILGFQRQPLQVLLG